MTPRWYAGLSRALVLAALLLIWLTALPELLWALSRPYVRDAWEAGQVTEALRWMAGETLYQAPGQTISPQFYGPLTPAVYGSLFSLTGPYPIAGRALNLLCAVLIGLALRRLVRARLDAWGEAGFWSMLLGIGAISGNYFINLRPDTMGLALSLWGLVGLSRGIERDRWWPVLAGSLLLVLAMLVRQPTMIFAGVPLTALVLLRVGGEPLKMRSLAQAMLPLLLVAVVLLLLRFGWPVVWHFAFVLPARWPIALKDLLQQLVLLPPMCLPLLIALAASRPRTLEPAERWTLGWTVALLVVGYAASALLLAKLGASYNSRLPFLLACLGLTAWLLRSDLPPAQQLRRPGLVSAALIAAALCSLLPPLRWIPVWTDRQIADHAAVVAALAGLPLDSNVQSPENPVLVHAATGRIVENGVQRLDTVIWAEQPQRMAEVLAGADVVVDLQGNGNDAIDWALLRSLGFRCAVEYGRYTLWHSARLERLPDAVVSAGAPCGEVERYVP